MTAKQAWEKICAHIKRGSRRNKLIILSLLLAVAGAFTLFIYVGIAFVAAAAVLLTVTIRRSKTDVTDVDALYEKYILREWFESVFDNVKFDRSARFKKEELTAAGVSENDWSDTVCNRCFTAEYRGYSLRAAEVVLSGSPGADSTRIGWNYEEPICFFWGRIWEISPDRVKGDVAVLSEKLENSGVSGRLRLRRADGRLYLMHNLYSSTGAYPWWLPCPNKDSLDYDRLEREAKESAEEYRRLLDMFTGETAEKTQ